MLQSSFRRVPVDPNDWKTELRGASWLAAIGLLVVQLVLCFTPLFTDTQSNGRIALLLTFLAVLVGIHSLTLDYASQRPGSVVADGTPSLGCCLTCGARIRFAVVPELCKINAPPSQKHTYFGIRTRLRLNMWQNYPPLLGVVVEFLQLMSTSLLQR